MVRQHQSSELRRISGKHHPAGQQQYCTGAPRNEGLMFCYVEYGEEFMNMYGDIDEAFYYSIESMFSDFIWLILWTIFLCLV